MPRERDRTARGQVQRVLEDVAEVLPYVQRPDRHHPYVGWYADRGGEHIYLGYDAARAIVAADQLVTTRTNGRAA